MAGVQVVIDATPCSTISPSTTVILEAGWRVCACFDPFCHLACLRVYPVPRLIARLDASHGAGEGLTGEGVGGAVAEEELRIFGAAQTLASTQVVPTLLQLQLLPLAQRRLRFGASRHAGLPGGTMCPASQRPRACGCRLFSNATKE